MNLEHKEKQEVFDEYARNLNLKDWEELMYVFRHNIKNELTKLIFNATNLVQKKALERASENACIEPKGMMTRVDKESITNEKNLIK